MNVRRGGLGRGLGALIPTAPAEAEQPTDAATPEQEPVTADGPTPAADGTPSPSSPETAEQPAGAGEQPDGQPGPVPGASFREIPVEAITPNPRQPRQVFDEEAMAELVTSIREVGLLQPIVVRELEPDRYELVMGERRLRASRAAGLDVVPAIVRETADDAMLRDALLENLHRQQLNPLEEAAAYAQLLEEFGATHEELATRIGRSRPQVSNTIRLLNLSAPVQRRVAAGVLSAGHARALLSIEDPQAQDRLAERIVAEGLSVRSVEEIVSLGGEEGGEPKARASAKAPVAPGLADLSARLSDRFETRVRVDLGRSKGKIVIEFATLDDLERLVDLMAPGDLPPMDPHASAPHAE